MVCKSKGCVNRKIPFDSSMRAWIDPIIDHHRQILHELFFPTIILLGLAGLISMCLIPISSILTYMITIPILVSLVLDVLGSCHYVGDYSNRMFNSRIHWKIQNRKRELRKKYDID